ncbi:YcaO-like family protein [Micromonospora sp. M12]
MSARLAAYRVAVREHAARYADPHAGVLATAGQLRERGEHPVPWTELHTASGAVDDDPRRPVRWLPATVLGGTETVWVPAASALPTSAANGEGLAELTTAGAAAADSLDGVIDQGLADALAYHALTGVLRGVGGLTVVAEEDLVADDETAFVVKAAHRFGRHLAVYALTGAAPAHAVLAVTEAPDGRDWSLAGGFDPAATRLAAVRDLVGRIQVRHFEGTDTDLGDPVLADLDPATLTGAPPARAGRPVPRTGPPCWPPSPRRGQRVAGRDHHSGRTGDRGVPQRRGPAPPPRPGGRLKPPQQWSERGTHRGRRWKHADHSQRRAPRTGDRDLRNRGGGGRRRGARRHQLQLLLLELLQLQHVELLQHQHQHLQLRLTGVIEGPTLDRRRNPVTRWDVASVRTNRRRPTPASSPACLRWLHRGGTDADPPRDRR